MKHPEYDSPFELTMSDMITQIARDIDEMSWQAVQRVGINVDKDKLLIALRRDAERYREAYANGYDTGYEKRDEEIVRCKDCKHGKINICDEFTTCYNVGSCLYGNTRKSNWWCADGVKRDA